MLLSTLGPVRDDDYARPRGADPAKAVSVPIGFPRQGVSHDELSEEEKERWDELDWGDDDEDPPDSVGAKATNRWLLNADTVNKVLAHLMTHGQRVAGGDRLGKTIVFAQNQRHADFISKHIDANYPTYRGHFARVVTHQTEFAEDLIDKFSIADREPHIAISVDMLDTDIDVPELGNLVFLKVVRSKTKFWQMTERHPALSRPGRPRPEWPLSSATFRGQASRIGAIPNGRCLSRATPLLFRQKKTPDQFYQEVMQPVGCDDLLQGRGL